MSEAAVASSLAPAPRPAFPTDPVFDAALRDRLVWVPELGMGRLRVDVAPYDAAYFAKYEGYARTEMGRRITEARVELVRRYTKRAVTDVGIGSGAFILARPGLTWGYDVNPVAVEWLTTRGLFRNPYDGVPGSVTLWDTLEHLPDPSALLRNVAGYVFTSLPIVPGDGPPSRGWKHLRPDEHCWYWTRHGLRCWMESHGFRELHCNDDETRLGREDILTFVFARE